MNRNGHDGDLAHGRLKMALLRKGQVLENTTTGGRYRVTSGKINQGGFGEIYRGVRIESRSKMAPAVALKVCEDSLIWHGEAYFGRLLAEEPLVVPLYDAFPLVRGSGAARELKYVLVFQWMDGGTVHDILTTSRDPWPERVVRKAISDLLCVLELLHRRGICHADITPRNVFVDGKRLLLGDLGIAKQSLQDGPMSMHAGAPPIFIPTDVRSYRWSPSEDVFQLGLIALSLLAGKIITTQDVCGRALKALDASDSLKGWVRDALKNRPHRFRDADEARACLLDIPIKPARAPSSLRGKRVVFTGILPMKRDVAKRKAVRVGAIIQEQVNGQTDVVVRGRSNPHMIGEKHGTKLFDAQRLIRRGQSIAIIGAKRFDTLLARDLPQRRRRVRA